MGLRKSPKIQQICQGKRLYKRNKQHVNNNLQNESQERNCATYYSILQVAKRKLKLKKEIIPEVK